MRAKICGITTLNDATLAAQQGAWAIGFNFYQQSPRYIQPGQAKGIIEKSPNNVLKIGIFIEQSDKDILSEMDAIGLDLIQIYSPIKASKALQQRMILCVQAGYQSELPDKEILQSYGYLLLDAPPYPDRLLGGTGRQSNWELAKSLAKQHRLILAGGLTAENVTAAIQTVNPYAVDVASGIECRPGIKHTGRMAQFLECCNHVC